MRHVYNMEKKLQLHGNDFCKEGEIIVLMDGAWQMKVWLVRDDLREGNVRGGMLF